MTDDELAATCLADEARGEPYEGLVAVGVVIRNRMARKYQSNGDVQSTVLGKGPPAAPYSGFWYDMVGGKYVRVCETMADAEARAAAKFTTYSAQSIWGDCQRAWLDSEAWLAGDVVSFEPGPEFQKLNESAVLYLNPAISSASWATPDKLICTIFSHQFFRDP